MKSNQIPPGSFGIPVLGETLPLLSLGDITQSKFRGSCSSH